MADYTVIGLRGLAFTTLLLAAGSAIYLRLFDATVDRSFGAVRRLAIICAIAGLLLTCLHALIDPARLTGDFSGVFDISLHMLLLRSNAGLTLTARLTGLVLILGGLLTKKRGTSVIVLAGALLIAASFVLMGHTVASGLRWALAPLLLLHILTIAFWFGGLMPLLVSTRLEVAATAGAIVARFSWLAVRLVPIIFIAGIMLMLIMLDSWSELRSPYGISLLIKLAAFILLMGLAALNRSRYGPQIASESPLAHKAFQLTVLTEWMLIFAVVTLTAVMTSLFSPG